MQKNTSLKNRPYGYGGSYEDYEEGGKLCLFLGTERLGVMFVYDISDPANPVFQSTARPPVSGDRSLPGPEGVAYARCALRLSVLLEFPVLSPEL